MYVPKKQWRIIRGNNGATRVHHYASRQARDKAGAAWAERDGDVVLLELWAPDLPQDDLNRGWGTDGICKPPTVTVEIHNTYSDGHTSRRLIQVLAPRSSENLDHWFDTTVHEHTGDGHGVEYPDLASHYAATIITTHDATLIGARREWMD